MALTIPTSEAFRRRLTRDGQSIGKWYGVDLPVGVVAIEEDFDHINYETVVKWKTKQGHIHSMPYDASIESVNAVIVAMKLSC